MTFLEGLSRPRTVLFVLVLVVVMNGFLLYRCLAAPSGPCGAASGSFRTSDSIEEAADATEEPAAPRTNEADYPTEIGEIQNESVETFASSNGKLLRYDALTPYDIADLQANYSTLGDYDDRTENLAPPEEYEE